MQKKKCKKAEYLENFVYTCKRKKRTSKDSTIELQYKDSGTCINGINRLNNVATEQVPALLP